MTKPDRLDAAIKTLIEAYKYLYNGGPEPGEDGPFFDDTDSPGVQAVLEWLIEFERRTTK